MTSAIIAPGMTALLPDRTAAPAIPATGGAIAWSGDEPALRRLAWRHAGLTLATLGLYRFWAKTEWRRQIWGSIRIDGRPLVYTGTVRELLFPVICIGLGLVGVLVGLLIAKYFAVPRPRMTPSPWRFSVTIPLVYMLGIGAWRARSYLVTRTYMLGVPGRLEGSRFVYAGWHLATALAMPLTLGLALPWRQVALNRQLIGGMELGHRRFTFEARTVTLLGRFALAWIAGLGLYLAAVLGLAFTPTGARIAMASRSGIWPSFSAGDIATMAAIAVAGLAAFALVLAWYRIGMLRHLAEATRMDGRRFRLEAGTWEYMRLALGNTALKAGSAMLLAPLAELRHTQFIVSRLRLG